MFFAPEMGGYFLEHANFEPADPLQDARAHRAGVVLHAVLRDPARRAEQAVRRGSDGRAVLAFFFVPWLDRAQVKSIRYRGRIFKAFLIAFAISFVALGYLGLQPRRPAYTNAARVFAVVYFRVLPADALVHEDRPDQAGAGAGDLPCPLEQQADERWRFAAGAASRSLGPPRRGPGGAHVQPANNDVANIASLQRGARNFVNYCMGCHSAKYVRYSRLGADSACPSSR